MSDPNAPMPRRMSRGRTARPIPPSRAGTWEGRDMDVCMEVCVEGSVNGVYSEFKHGRQIGVRSYSERAVYSILEYIRQLQVVDRPQNMDAGNEGWRALTRRERGPTAPAERSRTLRPWEPRTPTEGTQGNTMRNGWSTQHPHRADASGSETLRAGGRGAS